MEKQNLEKITNEQNLATAPAKTIRTLEDYDAVYEEVIEAKVDELERKMPEGKIDLFVPEFWNNFASYVEREMVSHNYNEIKKLEGYERLVQESAFSSLIGTTLGSCINRYLTVFLEENKISERESRDEIKSALAPIPFNSYIFAPVESSEFNYNGVIYDRTTKEMNANYLEIHKQLRDRVISARVKLRDNPKFEEIKDATQNVLDAFLGVHKLYQFKKHEENVIDAKKYIFKVKPDADAAKLEESFGHLAKTYFGIGRLTGHAKFAIYGNPHFSSYPIE